MRMLSTGNSASDKFIPTTVRLNLGCVRISEITLDALQIRGGANGLQNPTAGVDMLNIRLSGENLLFKGMSSTMVSGDTVDTAVFANVLIDGSGVNHQRTAFDTDKPTCDVVPPTNLKQLKVEVSKVSGTDEIDMGSQNASIDMVFSLYSEDSVSP